ncbi:GntR family transcriptional regulator [Streptomyces nigrescens]|uniref:GntR family transcriptional regulator n=1 Tax=Streptomyces nigrescens TaxID=1920 RepID=A0A640TA69_STRNI|nr:GntR family transcriptional regulator [Streptomyces libani]WAT94925.1 GntR family transcriptional regulator [Streptomyces libani subsp. libani]GFE20074.1 GntR family transcriptional regulator [Streptomyces libani subsp. libani]GGV85766.1 GntR family transcriptional regulator [Streptomyces libani subsp. libani]
MKDPAQSKRPRYVEIADELRARIDSGAYAATGKLPSERDLTIEFDAARNTVRDALGILRGEDLIESRGGSGVYLRTFERIPRDAVERLSRKHWGAGRAVWDSDLQGRDRQENVTVEKVDAPDEVAGTLGVRGEQVWRRSRVYHSEKRPIQQSTAWYPADLVEGTAITKRNTGPGGVYARLDEIGHGPARYREELKVRLPLSAESKTLGITLSTPVILIVRTAYDSSDRPVEVNQMMLDADSYRLIYTFPS